MAQACDRIVRSLRHSGLDVDLAHLSRRLDREKVEKQFNGQYIGCPVAEDPAHALHLLWNLLTQNGNAPDYSHVVAFGGVLPLLAGPTFAAWLRAPLTTLLRGNDFDIGLFTPQRSDTLLRALEASQSVCVVTREHAWKLARLHPGIPVRYIPNGIDLGEWSCVRSDSQRAQEWRKANVSGGRQVLGMFGQIKPKKGALFFLECLLESSVADRFHLLFVGDIESAVATWLEAHREEVSHTVLPFVDRLELLQWYAACNWMVLPSLYDGLPNVLLEAAALGIPCLAAKTGGMADFLKHRQHGLLFSPVDRAACRQILREAANTSSRERAGYGEAILQMAKAEFSHQRECSQYLCLFRNATGVCNPITS